MSEKKRKTDQSNILALSFDGSSLGNRFVSSTWAIDDIGFRAMHFGKSFGETKSKQITGCD